MNRDKAEMARIEAGRRKSAHEYEMTIRVLKHGAHWEPREIFEELEALVNEVVEDTTIEILSGGGEKVRQAGQASAETAAKQEPARCAKCFHWSITHGTEWCAKCDCTGYDAPETAVAPI